MVIQSCASARDGQNPAYRPSGPFSFFIFAPTRYASFMTDDNEHGWEIRIAGLHKAFGAHRVLCGVDLDIRRGELVAFVGGSGCGKTVLLNHILSQLEPDADRKSTRLNSSHITISYAVFCLKKKKKIY